MTVPREVTRMGNSTLCMAVGCRFRFLRLSFLAGVAPEVAVNTTAHSPCALGGLPLEDAALRLFPHPARAVPFDADAIVPTLYDPEDFAARCRAVSTMAKRSTAWLAPCFLAGAG